MLALAGSFGESEREGCATTRAMVDYKGGGPGEKAAMMNASKQSSKIDVASSEPARRFMYLGKFGAKTPGFEFRNI